eukprot:TRINITY_DN1839_c1_g1_i1.p1 TRINITY_DN1839_c1_g1~~TRINITY_DN1839_c1_g1_i1.p1  ORF type:complete len:423 (-),score=116.63 TRINITY_DN1839_c1_g1_i1:134-1402(-)
MRMLLLSLLPSLAAAVAVQQQGFLSSGVRRSVADCSCDCCLSARANRADNEKLSCVPRGGPVAPQTELGQGNCDALCLKPQDQLGESFAAVGSEVDYSRYCSAACAPAGEILDALCANAQEVKAAQVQLDELPAVGLAAKKAPESNPEKEELESLGEQAAVSLAKAAMMRAERHAREAKQSAKLAQFAYEQLQKSREAASNAAGQAALEKVIIEARQDANRAGAIRVGWEDKQRAGAVHQAIVAAALYKREKNKALALAEEWDNSARDFEKAVTEYEGYSERQLVKGNSLRTQLATMQANLKVVTRELNAINDVTNKTEPRNDVTGKPLSEEETEQREQNKKAYEERIPTLVTEIHNAEEKASEGAAASDRYSEQARESRKTAQKIRDQSGWYDQAEAAAAANKMYSMLPKDVMAPMMPPLP